MAPFPVEPQSASRVVRRGRYRCSLRAEHHEGDQEGQECHSSLWAQDNITSSPFHQAANQWPMARVPSESFIWPGFEAGLPQTPKYLGPRRVLSTPVTPGPGTLACLTTAKQWCLQATPQGTVPTSPWALDHHLVGVDWKQPKHCPWRSMLTKARGLHAATLGLGDPAQQPLGQV